jgi:hypothetical protein
MAHRMCVDCRIRTQATEECDDSVAQLCPDCGAVLEPVGSLSSIMGFRSISSSGRDGDGASDQAPTGLPESVFSRRGAFGRARFDDEFDEYDDDDGLCAGAVSLPWPDTTR